MRIILDARMAALGPVHGIARYVTRLLDHFPELAPDLEFRLLVHRSDLREAKRRFPSYGLIPTMSRPFDLLEQLEIPYLVWRSQADIIHFTSIAVAHCFAVPTVVTVHDMIPFLFEASLVRRLFARLVLGPVARRAQGLLAGSRHTKADIVRLLGVDEAKIAVSYYGYDEPDGQIEGEVVQRYDLRKPYLMCVGNPKSHKNLAFLLRAFAESPLPLQLLLVSADSPELARLIGQDPRVVRVHPLPEADLQSLYAQAWAVVSPSLYEGFGLTPVEAMAHGTPVLVADATSLPEVVGSAGLLFDPCDEESLRKQLQRLFDDPDLRERLKKAGPEEVRRFSWRGTAQRHVALYREVGRRRGSLS